jgi:hypothetical protein
MTTAHSKIGASSMDRWSACPGSVRLSEGIPSTSSVYAEEGTLAHSLAADWLANGIKPSFVDNDMHDAVAVYVDYIAPKQATHIVYLEHRFDLSSVHSGCFGTADCVAWHPATQHLEVIDYKHGAGVYVPAVENPQLRYYGLGALLDLKLPAKTITLTIVQPRYEAHEGPIRSETLDVLDMLDFLADLKQYAAATEAPDAPLHPGEHCRWCPAARICPELSTQANEVAKMEFGNSPTYDAAKLKEALDKREIVKAWLKTIDEFAYDVLEKGGAIPTYKLVSKRATRKWRDPVAAQAALELFGDDIYEPTTLKTPAQMEKIVKDKKLIEGLVVAESSGHTLVSESDPRPAVKRTAVEDFSAL